MHTSTVHTYMLMHEVQHGELFNVFQEPDQQRAKCMKRKSGIMNTHSLKRSPGLSTPKMTNLQDSKNRYFGIIINLS